MFRGRLRTAVSTGLFRERVRGVTADVALRIPAVARRVAGRAPDSQAAHRLAGISRRMRPHRNHAGVKSGHTTLGGAAAMLLAAGLALMPVLSCSAPSSDDPTAAAVPPAGPLSSTASPEPVPPPAALEDAAAAAGGSVAAVVLGPGGDLRTASDPDRRLPAASLVKVLVVEELLRREAAGTATLTPTDRDRMAAALTRSDDSAMDELWSRYDGAALVIAAAERHGLTDTAPPPAPGQWGLTPTTARDIAIVLSALARDDGAVGTTVLGWLRMVTTTAADGFDQRFGALSAGAVAAKQGWMCCPDGRKHLHSAGVLADGRVAVLLGEFPGETPWPAATRALDDAAGALVAATTYP